MTTPPSGTRGIELSRNPELHLVHFSGRKLEAGRHHSDDAAGCSVGTDVAADDLRIAAIRALPQSMREHRHERPSRRIVLRSERSAELRRYAQHREHPAGDVAFRGANRL